MKTNQPKKLNGTPVHYLLRMIS